MVERSAKGASGDDPLCGVCQEPIKAFDKVRGRSDELVHEWCDATQRSAPRRPPSYLSVRRRDVT